MNDGARLSDNLARVRARIAAAARRSGRAPGDVQLVAVTKYVDVAVTRQLIAAGCSCLSEARPQELWHKADALAGESIEWHLIGHLQRNKIARTLPLARLIHSGDSLRLLQSLDAEARRADLRTVPVLIEVNVSGDAAKHGFQPEELEPMGETLAGFKHLAIGGLMCMAGREGDLEEARRDFKKLRLLRDRLRSAWPEGLGLTQLSMGMSGDFEVAIEEGATLVRIGSLLYEGIEKA
jgi:pyridoxal phosphate enzyme (YggS family)